MEQIVREPSDEMVVRIEEQRDWVRVHYNRHNIYKYETVAGKLELIDLIIKSNWINKDETYKLQCLGVILGDVFIQDLNFRWIEIEDDYGIDPAIKFNHTSIILFPLTMISKRIEREEDVDVYELYEGLKAKVGELKSKDW